MISLTLRVWRIKINPILRGWLSVGKIRLINIKLIIIVIISANSLYKISILDIDDELLFFAEVLENFLSMIYKIIILFKLLKLLINYFLTNLNLINYLILIIIFSGVSVFCSKRKHLLLTLLRLEYLVLVIFLIFFIFILSIIIEGYFVLVFLTFSVCEGALGLGILVSLIRCHGNDNMMSLSSLIW